MTVKFNKPVFIGSRTYAAGETADLPPEQAARVLADGTAVQAKAKPAPIETATDKSKPAETADADPLPRGIARSNGGK
jgi:acyl dehydratase